MLLDALMFKPIQFYVCAKKTMLQEIYITNVAHIKKRRIIVCQSMFTT